MISYRSLLYNTTVLYDSSCMIFLTLVTFRNVKFDWIIAFIMTEIF